ncbi:MAG: hypothetical protein KA175_10510 [Flavobacteriales bacterium]|nr:hypothetical protein [Flavobacteriales bacterium]MBP6698041.1 hypothetical protein [Flavobacteriales bacterium]
MHGKNNIAIGFLVMGAFMLYGFLLIYLRDFAPDKQAWVDSYSSGKHFEARLAHVHGNLFAFLNVVVGYLLLHFRERLRHVAAISWLAITGHLMPMGILAEVYLGAPPVFVLIGAIAMTTSVFWLGASFLTLKNDHGH